MFSGTFRHPTALLPPSFKLRSQTRKKVENFLKILFVYRTFFTPFLRFYPPSASGERSFALPASLNRASSPPLPRTRLRCATTLEMPYILRALFYIIIFAAAWITSPAFTDNLAELPLIAETRCCIRISSSVPYVVPAICMQGLARSLRGDRRAVLSLPTRPNAAKTPPEGGVCLSQIQSLYIGLIAETLRYLPSSNAFHGTDSSGG